MFDRDLILIQGERSSGKSIFAYEFAKYLTFNGYKICYISCSDSVDYMNKIFDTTKTLNSTPYNNEKTIRLINELVRGKRFDYLVVDDIDFLTKDCILEIIKLPVKKLFTYTEFILIEKPKELDTEPLKISSKYCDSELKNCWYLEKSDYSEKFVTIPELLKKKIRDKKINLILDEK
jgi:archaellum biogenesis ATPase FlaH